MTKSKLTTLKIQLSETYKALTSAVECGNKDLALTLVDILKNQNSDLVHYTAHLEVKEVKDKLVIAQGAILSLISNTNEEVTDEQN